MSSRHTLLAVFFSALTFSVAASAGLTSIEAGKFKVEGAAKPKIGPRLSFDGKGHVSAKEEGDKVVFEADLKRLDMGERTEHAKEDFECKKHPVARLVVDKSAIKIPEDNKKSEGQVSGMLTLHGETKPVKVSYKVARTGSDYHVKSASFSFDYTAFGVAPICRFGKTICVEPTVKVTVSGLKLRDK
jgi:polyisoprenoid-binding protein YceI